MRLLLDTHAFFWAISDEPRLGPRSRDLITTEASSVLISQVSLWEIASKHGLTRSDMPLSAAQAIPPADARAVAPPSPRSV
jgi:PIN domain nuclease of toxin-antitoxin system